MKTQIIQLSNKEDTISVKDKMSGCQTGRILLVWPTQGRILNRQLDIVLIKRFANSLGSELAFVTHDQEVRYIAGQVGVQIYESVLQAQERDWESSKNQPIVRRLDFLRPDLERLGASFRHKKESWWTHPVVSYACLGISLLAIITLVIFFLPGARVIIAPKETVQSIQLEVYAAPAATTVNLSSGSLPTYNREVILEGSEVISTTGSLSIPHDPAQVSLLFTNKSHQEITIPRKTIVSTKDEYPVRFVTQTPNDVIVKPNKSVNIEAQAIKPGSGGNLPAESLVAIEGNLGMLLAVTNPDAATGGTDMVVKTPNQQDLEDVRARLNSNLTAEALHALQSSLPDGDILVLSSAKVSDTLEESIRPRIDEPGDQVEMFRRLRIQVQVVSGEILRSFVTPILNSNLPDGYFPVPASLQVIPLRAQETLADGRTHWKIKVIRNLSAKIPANQLAESIKGTTIAQAIDRLTAAVPMEERAEIVLAPRWWPRLPFLAMRITFTPAETQ